MIVAQTFLNNNMGQTGYLEFPYFSRFHNKVTLMILLGWQVHRPQYNWMCFMTVGSYLGPLIAFVMVCPHSYVHNN